MRKIYHTEEQKREAQRAYDHKRQQTEHRRAYDRERHNTPEHNTQRRARAAIKREIRLLEKQGKVPTSVKQLKMFKVCPKCAIPIEKPLSDFPQDKKRPDEHGVYCKECNRAWAHSEEAMAQERARKRERMLDPVYHQNAREKNNAWRRAHPESQQELTLRRNARKKAATTERVSFKRILERDGYWCYICESNIDPSAKKRSPESLTFDHIIPLQPRPGEPQGSHSESNIRPAHKVCNARKANKPFAAMTPFERRGIHYS